MKLADHTDFIRKKIEQTFINKLGRLGVQSSLLTDQINPSPGEREERERMEVVLKVFIKETSSTKEGYEKLVEELTFTLFNRMAALKVMEAHVLLPEVITRRSEHGDRSFAHLAWLEQHPEARSQELEGLLSFVESQLELLSNEIPLFSLYHPYHLMPTPTELLGIIQAFNGVEQDTQVEQEIWKSDDVLGWLYESYNNEKKKNHKDGGGKTEYNKVSIQSQVYTPKWVVKFLVDNSLGKLYLEMFPDSDIGNKYKIANAPKTRTRALKPIHEIRLIDPSNGSGNFLLYGFDLFYDLYIDQIENYDADYDKRDIPKLIIENNLYGVDLDDRAVQLAQLGLYIKAKRKKRNIRIEHFNVVSSDFFLPDYDDVREMFEGKDGIPERHSNIIAALWEDLQNAYKFGSLIRLEEKMNLKWFGTKSKASDVQITMFEEENLEQFEYFRQGFFKNLSTAIAQNTVREGQTFLNTKTQDAITFLQVLTQKYDVAVANPPYTDSSDFGTELKKFIDTNYKKPLKFNGNLYVTFIKKCHELTTENGYIAMIHPFSFMFIKTFEDVRHLILERTHIDLLVDFGLDRVNLFDGGYASAPTFYILSKQVKNIPTAFFKLTVGIQERDKKHYFELSFDDYISGKSNQRLFVLHQEKLKIIEGSPFIYWISDDFRDKFKESAIIKTAEAIAVGVQLPTTVQTLFHWETDSTDFVVYLKGGEFNKWHGNKWLKVKKEKLLLNSSEHKRQGLTAITAGRQSGKGASFRIKETTDIVDNGTMNAFFENHDYLYYALGYSNSKLIFYLLDCLNPTVNKQVGDLKRLPFVLPDNITLKVIASLSKLNKEIKVELSTFKIIETNFGQSPLTGFLGSALKDRILAYLNFLNSKLTEVLINEAIINELIFEVNELSDADREQVEAKMGKSIGSLPVVSEAKSEFLSQLEDPLPEVSEYIHNLDIAIFEEQTLRETKGGFATLYQSNNDLEEFCIRHQVNPINIWYWFREANVLPQARASEIALEFLADAVRTILKDDEDGIIPLVGLPGEPRLLDRLEEHCLKQGLTSAQFMQLDGLLGRPINEYLEHHFFKNLSDHLNLFMYLPKTPFIWHLSSGPYQGFEAYIIIYKWNRDSLFRLKSQYISKRIESLEYRQLSLQDVTSAQAMNERELIIKQLDEIEKFSKKVDELIDEGYDPILDSGVGKNIAPLQKKGMLRSEVLKDKQLEKYLLADW